MFCIQVPPVSSRVGRQTSLCGAFFPHLLRHGSGVGYLLMGLVWFVFFLQRRLFCSHEKKLTLPKLMLFTSPPPTAFFIDIPVLDLEERVKREKRRTKNKIFFHKENSFDLSILRTTLAKYREPTKKAIFYQPPPILTRAINLVLSSEQRTSTPRTSVFFIRTPPRGRGWGREGNGEIS